MHGLLSCRDKLLRRPRTRLQIFTLPFEREVVLSESLFANHPCRVAMVTASHPTGRIQLLKDTLDVRFHSAFANKKHHSP
jgi:hypothetical protein